MDVKIKNEMDTTILSWVLSLINTKEFLAPGLGSALPPTQNSAGHIQVVLCPVWELHTASKDCTRLPCAEHHAVHLPRLWAVTEA